MSNARLVFDPFFTFRIPNIYCVKLIARVPWVTNKISQAGVLRFLSSKHVDFVSWAFPSAAISPRASPMNNTAFSFCEVDKKWPGMEMMSSDGRIITIF